MPTAARADGLRVVMVAPTPFFSDRGCHVRIYEEARGLARAGAAVTVCTYFLGDDPPGVEVRRAGGWPGYRKRSAGPAWGKLALDVRLWRLVSRVVGDVRPHVLHAHLHEGIAIASKVSMPGVKRVLDVQGSLTDEVLDHRFLPRRGPFRRLLERVEGRLDRSADMVITSHHAVGEELTARFGVARDRVRLVGDAGTLGEAPSGAAERYRGEWGVSATEPVVLFTGALGEHQGTPYLLTLAQALKDRDVPGRVVVAGYPEARWREEAGRRNLRERIVFPGRFAYDEYAGILAAATVAVSPKISRTEGNQKLCAYLEAGLPVVAFETPATLEILADAGIPVPLGDGARFTEEVLRLLEDAETRKSLGRAAKARAREVGTWDDVVTRILDAYNAC